MQKPGTITTFSRKMSLNIIILSKGFNPGLKDQLVPAN
jgi:hypothetical protein